MKTDVCILSENSEFINDILDITEKSAKYNGLNQNQVLRLRLLAEELVCMLPDLLQYCSGEFWIETNGLEYELHVKVLPYDLNTDEREKLLSVSKSGKNAAAVGILNKIRVAVDVMLSGYASAVASGAVPMDDFYNIGMNVNPLYSNAWSLYNYREKVRNMGEETEQWDELEKSVIANFADDVIVGIIGSNVNIVIKKNFA